MSTATMLRRAEVNNGSSEVSDEFDYLSMSLLHPENTHIRVGWVRFTPSIAKRLLKMNVANRDVKIRGAKQIVEDQRAGSWNNENPDPIVVDCDGRLQNGQHRLLGVVETGLPIVALVVIGVSPTVMETLDTGTGRSLTDTLTIENRLYGAGHKNISYLTGCIVACFRFRERDSLSQGGGTVYTRSQLLSFYRENRPWIERLVSWAISTHRKMPATASVTPVRRLCAFRFALESSGAQMDDMEMFFSMLIEEQEASPAVKALRKRLQSLQLECNRKRRPSEDLVMALIVKGWNFYLEGSEPSHLTWKAGAAGKESFPSLRVVGE